MLMLVFLTTKQEIGSAQRWRQTSSRLRLERVTAYIIPHVCGIAGHVPARNRLRCAVICIAFARSIEHKAKHFIVRATTIDTIGITTSTTSMAGITHHIPLRILVFRLQAADRHVREQGWDVLTVEELGDDVAVHELDVGVVACIEDVLYLFACDCHVAVVEDEDC